VPDVGDPKVASLTVDPFDDDTTTVTLSVLAPDGTTLTPAVDDSAGGGVYTADVDFSIPGKWILHWTVAGVGAGVQFQTVMVTGAPTTTWQWPPTLRDLKIDKKISLDDERDDEGLDQVLSAAISFVMRVRGADFNFDDDSASTLPAPTADLCLGTIRLAGRWDTRRRSADGMIVMAEMGATRVASFDPDIDRMLGIGRFAPPVFA
jgi:hypothetical protein